MPLNKQATCIGISARGLLGEGEWRESNSKRPCQRRDKKRHERKKESRKERSKEKKEETRRGVRIKRQDTRKPAVAGGHF